MMTGFICLQRISPWWTVFLEPPPLESFDVKLRTANHLKHFVVKVEVNHSTDFNDYFPKNAQVGDSNYSGGKEGSGQPAVIYKAEVDLTTGKKTLRLL